MSHTAHHMERWTLQEFQELELNAPESEKWELIDGVIWKMMIGGTLAHNEIVGNIAYAARMAIRAKGLPCRAYTENAKVTSDRHNLSAYPDIVVRCGARLSGQKEITDPVLIVEVLSRSTGEKDRYDKAEAYFRLPTLRTYLLVSQNAMDVTILTRGQADWMRRRLYKPTDAAALPEIGLTLTLAEIYDGVVEITG